MLDVHKRTWLILTGDEDLNKLIFRFCGETPCLVGSEQGASFLEPQWTRSAKQKLP